MATLHSGNVQAASPAVGKRALALLADPPVPPPLRYTLTGGLLYLLELLQRTTKLFLRRLSSQYAAATSQAVSTHRRNARLDPGAISFLDLPGELRNQIYSYVVSTTTDDGVLLCTDSAGWRRQVAKASALGQVNQLLRAEFSPLHYRKNTFHMDLSTRGIKRQCNLYALRTRPWLARRHACGAVGPSERTVSWLVILPLDHLRYIRHFKIEVSRRCSRSAMAETVCHLFWSPIQQRWMVSLEPLIQFGSTLTGPSMGELWDWADVLYERYSLCVALFDQAGGPTHQALARLFAALAEL
ncbi:hypothetical protein LTR85_006800 [Meristemomyces frigidus]|nr:hypothetical protein LTR85_006800 [Meristemomyces frigidus]